MDKFDEKAEKYFDSQYRGDSAKSMRTYLAAFGRECAAEAYEDASNKIDRIVTHSEKNSAMNYCCEKAAALRTK